ncbi:MAG TPA: hypothetical protein HA326_06345 [Thermoplasmata archaeon]|nr:hypothetical protein [Thermoplasmata archaeon]
MILGYVDASHRLYDMGFGTLKMKVRVESEGGAQRVVFSKASGEGEVSYRVLAGADVTASLAMDHDGHPVPLLRPVPGRAYRHEAGLLFVADPPRRDPEDPGFFLVQVRAMPSAVRFFFEDQEGTEVVSVPHDEILRVAPADRTATIYVTAESVALPKEKIAYALELAPGSRAGPLLTGLPLSR